MEINTITVFLLFKIRFIKLRQNIFINLFLSKIHSWWNFALFVLFIAAKNVTSREHTLKKSPIQVELWSPSQQCGCKGGSTMPMSKDASTPSAPAHYKDRVLVSGVPSETTSDLLLNYLECVADVAVEDIQKKGDSVLVIFKSSEQDFSRCFHLSICHPE